MNRCCMNNSKSLKKNTSRLSNIAEYQWKASVDCCGNKKVLTAEMKLKCKYVWFDHWSWCYMVHLILLNPGLDPDDRKTQNFFCWCVTKTFIWNHKSINFPEDMNCCWWSEWRMGRRQMICGNLVIQKQRCSVKLTQILILSDDDDDMMSGWYDHMTTIIIIVIIIMVIIIMVWGRQKDSKFHARFTEHTICHNLHNRISRPWLEVWNKYLSSHKIDFYLFTSIWQSYTKQQGPLWPLNHQSQSEYFLLQMSTKELVIEFGKSWWCWWWWWRWWWWLRLK